MAKKSFGGAIAAALVGACVALGSVNVAVADDHREEGAKVSKEEHQKRKEQFKERREEKKQKAENRLNEISQAANLSEDQKAKLAAYFKKKHEQKRAELAQKCGVSLDDASQEAKAKLMACLKEMKGKK